MTTTTRKRNDYRNVLLEAVDDAEAAKIVGDLAVLHQSPVIYHSIAPLAIAADIHSRRDFLSHLNKWRDALRKRINADDHPIIYLYDMDTAHGGVTDDNKRLDDNHALLQREIIEAMRCRLPGSGVLVGRIGNGGQGHPDHVNYGDWMAWEICDAATLENMDHRLPANEHLKLPIPIETQVAEREAIIIRLENTVADLVTAQWKDQDDIFARTARSVAEYLESRGRNHGAGRIKRCLRNTNPDPHITRFHVAENPYAQAWSYFIDRLIGEHRGLEEDVRRMILNRSEAALLGGSYNYNAVIIADSREQADGAARTIASYHALPFFKIDLRAMIAETIEKLESPSGKTSVPGYEIKQIVARIRTAMDERRAVYYIEGYYENLYRLMRYHTTALSDNLRELMKRKEGASILLLGGYVPEAYDAIHKAAKRERIGIIDVT